MKKLIFFLVLFPCILFSQEVPNVVLLEKVTKICHSDESNGIFQCTMDTNNYKLYVENNILFIKCDLGINKYKILSYSDSKKNNKIISQYVIDIMGVRYDLIVYYNKNNDKEISLSNNDKIFFTYYK